ncbi:site-specific integrase [Frankia sp. BMG5.23]|uniref:site-specific integrase n=1 Tax=Frankia sp. BMG5.23 TaxID=683305 RepID=UPI0004612704|nr:site-specific integrase [Frankia sp. BMG5.23]KDA41657.1 site-specific recombinase XerD [Frankia sp. BMG5.23]
MQNLLGVRVVGPLESYAAGFVEELRRLGFTPFATRDQLRLAAHLSRWMADRGTEVTGLSSTVTEEFLQVRRAAGYAQWLTPKALEPLLGYLRSLGAAPPPRAATAGSAVDSLLARFRDYLLGERGLGAESAEDYVALVRPFVAVRAGPDGALNLAGLTRGDVAGFVLDTARVRPAKSVQRAASALRGLLRFLHYDGLVPDLLVDAVPKVADRREQLPRFLEPDEAARLLASCDQATTAGRRDLAMMTLMTRLGLRAGEVATLSLGDLDWRRGEVIVRGKGGRVDRLPLPVDVGEAVAGYLRDGRPTTALDRRVFIRVKAPHRGLTSTGVTQAVIAAGRRAGLGPVTAHRLRHTAATGMLRAGSPLAEVGQVLRHRRPGTTAIYAKVDREALRALARPWPGSLS